MSLMGLMGVMGVKGCRGWEGFPLWRGLGGCKKKAVEKEADCFTRYAGFAMTLAFNIWLFSTLQQNHWSQRDHIIVIWCYKWLLTPAESHNLCDCSAVDFW